MTHDDKIKKEEHDIIEEMQEEINEVENQEGDVVEEKVDETLHPKEEVSPEDEKCRDILARTMADFDNFKKRVERDKLDMIFFIKSDIIKKILPRLDDLERILKNTPEEFKTWVLFEWLSSLEQKFKKDIENLWIKAFNSIGEEVNPDKHDVMTTIPWGQNGIIIDEFERWYMLWDRVLRHAKVVVWMWE